MNLNLYLLAQVLLTWAMIGIIWFVQVIHYPLYSKIKQGFTDYEREHMKRSLYLVGPIMILEAFTAIILVGISSPGTLTKLATTNLILLLFIWLATFLFQVYQHQKLVMHFSKRMLHMLVASNWIRTWLWTIKGFIVLWMVWYLL